MGRGYVYLDVRTVPEFDAGHPAGAYNVPLQLAGEQGMVDNPDFLAVVQASFARDQPLVLGCRSGNRSRSAALLLLQAGYRDVVDQRAGYSGARDAFGQLQERGWQDEQLPCAQEALPGRDYESLSSK